MSQVALRRPPDNLIKLGNPVVKGILRSPLHGVMSKSLLLLSVTGRSTGRVFTFPVAYVTLDGVITIITDHAWPRNVRGGAEVKVRIRGERMSAHADVVEDPDAVLQLTRRLVEQAGGWGKASRQGLDWSGDGAPTDEELAPALLHRAIVRLTDLRPAS